MRQADIPRSTRRNQLGLAPPSRCALWRAVVGLLGAAWGAGSAEAKTTKGPGVAVEQARPAAVRYLDAREDQPAPDLELDRRRYEANLLAPIPARVLGGMFVLKADFFKEQRHRRGADAPEAGARQNDLENPNVAGLGAIFLPHAKEGAPRVFVLVARYGSMSFADGAVPMSEYVLGADIADDDMPFPVKLDPSDDAETRVLVRYRQFPGFHRWLLLAGHKIEKASGWSLDFTMPSHVLIGWATADDAWKVYAGVRWTSREYPFETLVASGWQEGHATTYLAAFRRALAKPLYLALEVGAQKEELAYYDTKGETLASQETAFSPWARLALETWITTP